MEILVTYYKVFYYTSGDRCPHKVFRDDPEYHASAYERACAFYLMKKDRNARPTLVKITEQILAHN